MGFQIRANHYQMTYYMLLLMALYVGFQVWQHYKTKSLRSFMLATMRLIELGYLLLLLTQLPYLPQQNIPNLVHEGKAN